MQNFNSKQYHNLLSENNRSPLTALYETVKGSEISDAELTKIFNRYIKLEDYGSRKQKQEVLNDFIKRVRNYNPKENTKKSILSFHFEPPFAVIKRGA